MTNYLIRNEYKDPYIKNLDLTLSTEFYSQDKLNQVINKYYFKLPNRGKYDHFENKK